MLPVLLCLGALTAGCGGESSRPARDAGGGQQVLFEGARLIVGDGNLLETGDLLVGGARILAVGESGEIDPPADAVRIDVVGKTIVPALIDAHAHLGYEGYTEWGADSYTRDNLIEHLNRYAYYGFGAVFSAGTDPTELASDIARAQREGSLGGARLLFAAGVGPPGQGPNNNFVGHTLTLAETTGMTILRGAATPGGGPGHRAGGRRRGDRLHQDLGGRPGGEPGQALAGGIRRHRLGGGLTWHPGGGAPAERR